MTTLLDRCQALESKIDALTLAKRHANDHKVVQQRTQEWRDRNDRLKALVPKTDILALNADDAKTVSRRRSELQVNAETILARLKRIDDLNELTRDATWIRLLSSCEGLRSELETAGRKAWGAYLEAQGVLEKPAALRERTPQTPQNEEALRAYVSSYGQYEAIARLQLPRSAEDLGALKKHVSDCRQAFARLSFDLPEEIKRFFEAISIGTATLGHVTPPVLQWLSEHGQLERFCVRSATQ
jgi:hypothetical protein